MKISICWVFIVGFCCSYPVLAEGNCPSGYYPVGGQGVQGCAPIPGGGQGVGGFQSSPAPRTVGSWIKTWGAIAADQRTGDAGVAVGQTSKARAESVAMGYCSAFGGGGCEVSFTYKNQCAAMAQPSGNPTQKVIVQYAGGQSEDDAKNTAVRECTQANGVECEAIYSDCSEPIYVP